MERKPFMMRTLMLIIFSLLISGPSAFPSNVRLVAISSNEINVTWDAVPEEDVNGAVKSYNVSDTFGILQLLDET